GARTLLRPRRGRAHRAGARARHRRGRGAARRPRMTFGGVVGHAEAAARLARAAAEGRVPAAVLLVGPAGIGKRALADAFAARLLPTVRSRCQVVRLDPLPAAEVVRVLEASGVPAGQARELAPLAEGSPGRALALAGEAETRARACVLRDLPRLRELGADELSRTAQELSRGALDAGLATALAWYRDVLETALAGDAAALRNPAAADAVRLA